MKPASDDSPATSPTPPNPTPTRDPRLEIPEVLRTPIQHASLKPKPEPALAGLGELGKALSIGLDFLCTTAAGGGLGYLCDRWLLSAPKGLMIGLLIGFVIATIRIIQRTGRDDPPRPPRDVRKQ